MGDAVPQDDPTRAAQARADAATTPRPQKDDAPGASYPSYPTYPFYQPRRTPSGIPWYVWLIGAVVAVVGISVLACVVLGGLLAGALIRYADRAPATATNTYSFAVGGAPHLEVRDTAGAVTIRQGDAGHVTVAVSKTARASSLSAARRDLGHLPVAVTQRGDDILVTALFRQGDGLDSFDHTVDLAITVPAAADITADLDSGRLRADHISGRFDVMVDAGDVEMGDVTFADGSRIRLTAGNATLQGALAPGAALDARVATGTLRLTLPATTAAHLSATIGTGPITVTGWPLAPNGGNAPGSSVTGDLGADPRGTITLQVDTGAIALAQG